MSVKSFAIFFKHFDQMLADHLGISSLDVMSFNEMYEFSILEERNRRRRWGIGKRILPRLCNGFFVNSGKNSSERIRLLARILQCPLDARSRCTGSTSANRIDHQQCGAFVIA